MEEMGLGSTEWDTSSRVAEKESMSWWGSWDRKPMVSTKRTGMRLGSWPPCTVTSRVAKSWSRGCRPLSPVRALIRVVFPKREISQCEFNKDTISTVTDQLTEATF